MSVENLKKVVGFGLSVGEAIIAAGEQSSPLAKAAAMLHLLEDVPMLFGVDYSALQAEVLSMESEQLSELNAFIDENFDIPDDAREKSIEGAIEVVIDMAKVAQKAADMWRAKPAP